MRQKRKGAVWLIRAVAFDLDDTIYDYQNCNRYAMHQLKKYCMKCFSIQPDVFDELYGMARESVKKRLGKSGASHNRMLYAQAFLELISQKPAVYALDLYDIYWNSMLSTMKLYDYVPLLFEKLSALGIRIAVLTDLTAHIQHRKIKKLGISSYIDVLVTSEEAGKEKPDRAVFELAISKLGLLPEQIVMIGNSWIKDIKGAEDAGMYGILFEPEHADTVIQECMGLIRKEGGV